MAGRRDDPGFWKGHVMEQSSHFSSMNRGGRAQPRRIIAAPSLPIQARERRAPVLGPCARRSSKPQRHAQTCGRFPSSIGAAGRRWRGLESSPDRTRPDPHRFRVSTRLADFHGAKMFFQIRQ